MYYFFYKIYLKNKNVYNIFFYLKQKNLKNKFRIRKINLKKKNKNIRNLKVRTVVYLMKKLQNMN